MNEFLFLLHLAIVTLFIWPAIRLGKEALISWIVVQPILANLFVLKQISLFGFTVTCSDVYAVSCALGLNLLQEYFGKECAKKTVWLCFYALVFFVVMSLLHLLYLPSPYDVAQSSYARILGTTPRLAAASIISFLSVQWFDVRFFGYLKRQTRLSLYLRNSLSLTVSQAIDTLLFTFLGLWGHVDFLFDVFIISFIIKLAIGLLLSTSSLKKNAYEPVSI
jgi:uncharacterized integral membrane protein (TIGR00697 family)